MMPQTKAQRAAAATKKAATKKAAAKKAPYIPPATTGTKAGSNEWNGPEITTAIDDIREEEKQIAAIKAEVNAALAKRLEPHKKEIKERKEKVREDTEVPAKILNNMIAERRALDKALDAAEGVALSDAQRETLKAVREAAGWHKGLAGVQMDMFAGED